MTGPRGEYRKTAARKEQILDAAFAVFSKSGYSASSLSEIARVVGISQTGVLHHFKGGKTALLSAVLDRRDRDAEEHLAGLQGRAFLRELLEITRQQCDQRGVVQLYRILSAESIDPEHPAHQYFHDRLHRITGDLTVVFAELRSLGELRPGIDPRSAAKSSVALVEGLELLWLSGIDVDMVEDMRHHLDALLVRPL